TPEQAVTRLNGEGTIYIRLKNGTVEKVTSFKDLVTLDTLDGQGLRPNLDPQLVNAMRQLEMGRGAKDGIYKPNGKWVTAYDAYQILNSKHDGAFGHAALTGLGGLGVGGALAVGGLALVNQGIIPRNRKRLEDNVLYGIAGGVAVLGAV